MQKPFYYHASKGKTAKNEVKTVFSLEGNHPIDVTKDGLEFYELPK